MRDPLLEVSFTVDVGNIVLMIFIGETEDQTAFFLGFNRGGPNAASSM